MDNRNFISRVVSRVNRSPASVRPRALSLIFGRAVRFVGTAGVRVESLTDHESVLSLKNRKKVQNHLGTIHAAAMGLLVESASGLVVGLHVPDHRVPVIKTLHLDYVKRATGDLRAVASLSDEQISQIQSLDKGEVTVPVLLTDEKGLAPVKCEVIWAWTPKIRGSRSGPRSGPQSGSRSTSASA